MIARGRLHRAVFLAAGLYNLGWGFYSALDPGWLFRFAGMPPQNYPEIFACLGMVVGLYGILYLEVARAPERGWLLAAVGLSAQTILPPHTPLKIGDMAPDFTLPSTDGGSVHLADFRGKNSVVLAFFPAAFTGG